MTGKEARRGARLWACVIGLMMLGFIGGVLAMIIVNDLIAGIWQEALLVIAPVSLPVGALAGAGLAGGFGYRRLTRRS
ncbi:hypothetical protein [Brevibacterium aurantiacum]|uniref:Uncharacterized protein n=1 Tax=Brevibacterium aurantiacum TaxID=273384 RepID=A0A556C550_BREAU|nr:hypothetical protein [Brevibacterium aurantiacum]TSI12583.1 hypothetical protein FO013_19085 [Brevibacterium aurantiacum]